MTASAICKNHFLHYFIYVFRSVFNITESAGNNFDENEVVDLLSFNAADPQHNIH